MENWNRVKLLGNGSYGAVFLAVPPNGITDHDHNHHSLVAVKVAFLEHSSSLIIERNIFEHFIGCPEIVQCIGTCITTEGRDDSASFYNLVLEYAPGGTLADLITRREKLPEGEVKRYLRTILKGLSTIHKRGFVHCDLKPSNILVFPDQENDAGTPRLKIADFGLSKLGVAYVDDNRVIIDYVTKARFQGTPRYMSPESVIFGKINTGLDIWSLGCILIEMVSGKPVWSECESVEELMKKLVYQMEIPDIPEELSREGRDFLSRCIDQNSERRWTAEMLLNHAYLKEEDQERKVNNIADEIIVPLDYWSLPSSLEKGFFTEEDGFYGSCFESNPKKEEDGFYGSCFESNPKEEEDGFYGSCFESNPKEEEDDHQKLVYCSQGKRSDKANCNESGLLAVPDFISFINFVL